MSAVAALAATLDRPLGELFDNSVDEAPILPGQRNALRSVPASGQAGDEGSDDPLRLGRKMRLRLLAAVQALLADPSIAGLKDAPKLAAVVLYAKSRAPKGEKNDNQTSIWGAELGRWLGMKESTVHHKVLPALRGTDALHTQVVRNAKGHPTGLNCLVMPLWNARKSGGAAHPLALNKAELATLLRLIEALFGHGWTPEAKEPTPPGLLAGRTGKGAATDRLGLLLMVLHTRASGWLQLCGGSVRKKEGRGAATLARLLGCSPSGARKVLARLTEAGVVARQRKATATRMNGRGKVMVLPVARAYGRVLAPVEAVQGSEPVFSARPDGACGDHAPADVAGALGTSGIGGAEEIGKAGSQERPDGAELHAVHAPVVTPVVPPQLSCGFSGEGRGAEGRRPERVCVREDQAVDADAVDGLRLVDGEDGPLRGEQPKKSPSSISENGNCGRVAGAPVRVVDGAGQGRQQQGRGVLPPENLRVILEPVRLLWARLERPAARRLVEAAVRAELATVSGFVGPIDGPHVLADRLARRLEDQLRLGSPIKDPVGWLIGKGLPQRQECGDALCDDRMLLDSGRDCPRCEDRQASSRAQRHAVAVAVDTAMPYASETERRTAIDRQLHETVTARAWAREHEWEQVRARQAAAAAKARAEATAAHPALDDPAATLPAPVVLPAPRPAPAVPASQPEADAVDGDLVLEDLTREQVVDWRTRAARDHQVVFDHIDRYGETSAQRLFTRAFVADVQRLSRLGHLNLGYSTWERS
ncbi:hypothetical protein PV728_44015 [Streptomyces europaeiscabiei]|uniref:hypothetical protein n=1 Tax=Streptomyces europaeiscabiei TaxID=146819 RepID=UPI0029BBE902|nr:hypothetical protein [Streptomyces europaeiscabiei]MDX3637041.1 hypothetical protein [Streptomyces europaeiscabiei]MDX3655185.1 hypothetical protein [Streptomyces europaeiscabiei]